MREFGAGLRPAEQGLADRLHQFPFFNSELGVKLSDVHDIYRASVNKNSWVKIAGSEGLSVQLIY